MNRTEIMEFFSRRDAVWQQHDSAALAAEHWEDGDIDSPLFGMIQGRNAIRNTYAKWFSSFPDAAYSTERLLIDGNHAVQFAKMTGIQQGDFCGLSPTGRRFEIRCAFLFTFEDSRIAHEVRIYDFTSILLQLGVLKAKPAF
jgi:predicted ester cyclase